MSSAGRRQSMTTARNGNNRGEETMPKKKEVNQEIMLAKVEIEELSQLLQVSLQALKYIAQPAGANMSEPPGVVARQANEKIGVIRQGHNKVKSMIKKGEIAEMSSPSQVPPKVQLAEGGEIIFSTDHDLYFHQCCRCHLLHEVVVDWIGVPLKPGQRAELSTKWTRREAPPTREEMADRGIEVNEI